MSTPDLAAIRALPKVQLHDHLDGGLRPSTVIELAREIGHRLPSEDPAVLFPAGHAPSHSPAAGHAPHAALGVVPVVNSGVRDEGQDGGDEASGDTEDAPASGRPSLVTYLSAFAHTVGVLQTAEALERVAAEAVEDLAADGVVYAEIRFAPELHRRRGLTLDEVIGAVMTGVASGCAGRPIQVGVICSAIRTDDRASEVAEAALRWRDRGVVGFDLAGAEDGHPPSRHLAAFDAIRQANFHTTIHAGEAFGLPSIWEALQVCGSERLGHGVRIVDDIAADENGDALLGRLAASVRDRRVTLEMCPTSNLHTGTVDDLSNHPIDRLLRLRFRVTVNTDNRLMSGVTVSSEMKTLVDTFGYGFEELEWLTLNAAKGAFLPFDERVRLINNRILPGYAAGRHRGLGHSAGGADLGPDDPLGVQSGGIRRR